MSPPGVPKAAQQGIVGRLLSTVGRHRSQNVIPSEGKRHRKKRKRSEGGDQEEAPIHSRSMRDDDRRQPAAPKLLEHITIGFNSTNRYLEALAAGLAEKNSEQAPVQPPKLWMNAVFVARADQHPLLHAHLPLLINAASLAHPSKPPIRLVSLPSRAEQRLSAALNVARVGIIGLLDQAPGADALLKLVRAKTPVLEVPWLQDAIAGRYLPVSIKSIETTAPMNQRLKEPRRNEDLQKE